MRRKKAIIILLIVMEVLIASAVHIRAQTSARGLRRASTSKFSTAITIIN